MLEVQAPSVYLNSTFSHILLPQVQRDTTIASVSRSLSVTWQSLWQLNPDLPHPDFSLQVRQRCPPAAPLAALQPCRRGSPLSHVLLMLNRIPLVTVWVQPASLLYIGRLLKLPQARCILHPSCLKLTRGQANTLADVSPSFGCSIDTLLLLNNDIPNATAPLPAAAPICIIPDACLARAAEQPPTSFRDEEWFRSSQTQRT